MFSPDFIDVSHMIPRGSIDVGVAKGEFLISGATCEQCSTSFGSILLSSVRSITIRWRSFSIFINKASV